MALLKFDKSDGDVVRDRRAVSKGDHRNSDLKIVLALVAGGFDRIKCSSSISIQS